jgi:cytochrome b6-f complex iron-sulfur subunit
VLEKTKTSPEKKDGMSRRGFVSAVGIGWITVGVSSAASAGAFQRFLFPNVLEEPDPKIRCGPVETYANMAPGEVNEDYKPQGIWIIRLEDRIAALSTTCTHLGCIPNWLAADRKFKCPCHGSGFKQTGINFEGPAPRPLERYRMVVENDVLIVDKSKKFQQEKGEWVQADSFLIV